MAFNCQPLQAGWVVRLCRFRKVNKIAVCIWAGIPRKCSLGCSLDTKAYDHPIAIMDTRKTSDGRIELDFVVMTSSPKAYTIYTRPGKVQHEPDRSYWFELYWNSYKKLKVSYFKVPHVYRMSFDLTTHALENFPTREPRLKLQTAAWLQMSTESLEQLRKEAGYDQESVSLHLVTNNRRPSEASASQSDLSQTSSWGLATDSDWDSVLADDMTATHEETLESPTTSNLSTNNDVYESSENVEEPRRNLNSRALREPLNANAPIFRPAIQLPKRNLIADCPLPDRDISNQFIQDIFSTSENTHIGENQCSLQAKRSDVGDRTFVMGTATAVNEKENDEHAKRQEEGEDDDEGEKTTIMEEPQVIEPESNHCEPELEGSRLLIQVHNGPEVIATTKPRVTPIVAAGTHEADQPTRHQPMPRPASIRGPAADTAAAVMEPDWVKNLPPPLRWILRFCCGWRPERIPDLESGGAGFCSL